MSVLIVLLQNFIAHLPNLMTTSLLRCMSSSLLTFTPPSFILLSSRESESIVCVVCVCVSSLVCNIVALSLISLLTVRKENFSK